MFGENPREGFFQGTLFHHPDMAFRIEFPRGWRTANQREAVVAVSSKQDAAVVLRVVSAPNAQQAARGFFSQQGAEALEPWRQKIGGLPAVSSTFRVQTEKGVLLGLAAWVDYRERVFQILGYAPQSRWPQHNTLISEAVASFSRETDPAVLGATPRRLSVVELDHPATFEALLRDYPSTVDPKTVALINGLQGTSMLASGDSFKRVVGGQGR
jgi:predicted Zn-dependent protease